MAHWQRGGGNPDANQGPLIALARRLGATVKVVSQVGEFVDAVLGFRGTNLLWEIKVPGKAPERRKHARKLTKSEEHQADLRATWAGKIETIETVADVLKSLLTADLCRPLDYQQTPDDTVATFLRWLRVADRDIGKTLAEAEATAKKGRR